MVSPTDHTAGVQIRASGWQRDAQGPDAWKLPSRESGVVDYGQEVGGVRPVALVGPDADEADTTLGIDQEHAGTGNVPGLEVEADVDAVAADGGASGISQERARERQALREAPPAFRPLAIYADNTDLALLPFLQLARELRQITPAVRSPGMPEKDQQLPLPGGRHLAELVGI